VAGERAKRFIPTGSPILALSNSDPCASDIYPGPIKTMVIGADRAAAFATP